MVATQTQGEWDAGLVDADFADAGLADAVCVEVGFVDKADFQNTGATPSGPLLAPEITTPCPLSFFSTDRGPCSLPVTRISQP